MADFCVPIRNAALRGESFEFRRCIAGCEGLIATPADGRRCSFWLVNGGELKPFRSPWLQANGHGGLLAVNRTFNEDVLARRDRNHTLDAVLFPANPRATGAMQQFDGFPIAKGHQLFGPMVGSNGDTAIITIHSGLCSSRRALRLLVMGQSRRSCRGETTTGSG